MDSGTDEDGYTTYQPHTSAWQNVHATDGSSGSTRSSANVLSTGSLSQSHHSDLQMQPEDAEEVALHIRRMASTVPDLVRVAQQRLVAQREAEAANILYFTCGFCFLVTLSAALVFYAIAREAMWRPTPGKTETDTVPSTTTRSTSGISATSSTGAPGTAVTTDATT